MLEHPSLIPFLRKLKQSQVLANITVNQIHFEKDYDLIQQLINERLICGLGVSLVDPTAEFIEKVRSYPHTVIHVINGVVTKDQWQKLLDHELKVLILGYKDLRRGTEYHNEERDTIEKNQSWLYQTLPTYLGEFQVISFDNLAIEQLQVKRMFSEAEWN